jgi:tRNA pseudouridine38-40 synthase
MRIALGVEYDGTPYLGWQVQKDGPSVQARLEQALGRVAAQAVRLTGAGRTDAGVHATGQVAHFDTSASRSERGWMLGANAYLPADISVRWASDVPADFDARRSALARTYAYLVLTRPARAALWRHRAWWLHRPLDAARMAQAAACLVGEHDFSSFRAAECQAKTPFRRIDRIAIGRRGDFLALEVTANAFLHHMVRNITGTLVAVGKGDREPDWVGDVLTGRDRRLGGVTAPPEGLYLVHVDYGSLLPRARPEPPWPANGGADDWFIIGPNRSALHQHDGRRDSG